MMLSLIPRPYLILAVAALWLATAGVSFYQGYHTGATLTEARHAAEVQAAQEATMKAAEAASRAESERLAAQAEADKLAQELEDAARTDPMAGRPALGVDSGRRLSKR